MARRQQSSALTIAAAVLIITLVGFVIPLAVANHYGATGIPRDDDWSYLRALFHWMDTGQIDFNNWVSMTLLGQLYLTAPAVLIFGNSITAAQVVTALLGLVGLLAVLWLGVILTGRLWVATFISVLVAVGPLLGVLSVSYMTDVPAFAFTVLACTLGVRALSSERVSLGHLIGALVAAFIGFTIRQYTVVPLVALVLIGGWSLLREGRNRRLRTFLVVTVVLAVAALAVLAYWRTIPNVKSLTPNFPDSHSIRATFYKGTGLIRLLGLLLTPAIVLAGPVRIVRRALNVAGLLAIVLGVGSLGVLLYAAVSAPRIAFAGNFVVPNGVLGNSVLDGNRPDILPTGGWTFLVLIGTGAAVLLLLALVPFLVDLWTRSRHGSLEPREPAIVLLGLVILGYVTGYLLGALTGLPLADRYILPVLPLAAVLLVRRPQTDAGTAPDPAAATHRRERRAFAFAALGALWLVGVLYTVDSASFDGTRWDVAVAATREGWSPKQVRGGFEWTNFHDSGPHRDGGGQRPACVTVVVDPPGGVRGEDVVAVEYYRTPLKDAVPIVALRTRLPCIPAGSHADDR